MAVFINDGGLIKDAYNMAELSGRPPMPHHTINGNIRGILSMNGKVWTEQRRFVYSYIQSGFRNGIPVETTVIHEANELVGYIKELCAKPISTTHLFSVPALNIIWGIVAGESNSLRDPYMMKIVEHVIEYTSSPANLGILVFAFKWAKMFPKISGYKHYQENLKPVLSFIQNIIDRHTETYEEGVQRDLIDCFRQKIKATTDENSSFFGTVGEENMLQSIHDTLLGGMETVSTTLRWLVFLMAHHPEKQEKLSNIIGEYMQQRKDPVLKDRQMLPYVEAVINEVVRFSSLTPIGIMHCALQDTQFHGYIIPKDTMVIGNLYAAHHDPDVWGDPERFRPERFLNKDESEVVRHPSFIPFSAGKRACPGEALARDELFIFTMKLMQSFKVEFNPNEPTPPLKYVFGSLLLPVEHKILFSER